MREARKREAGENLGLLAADAYIVRQHIKVRHIYLSSKGRVSLEQRCRLQQKRR